MFYLRMTEPGEVLDYLEQTEPWLSELEVVDSVAGALQVEEPA